MAARAHRLGFAVKLLGDGGLPSHDARRWQSGPHLRDQLAARGLPWRDGRVLVDRESR